MAGIDGLFAFGVSCWASDALLTCQHMGRWGTTMPLSTAVLGAVAAVYGIRAARRWLDRVYPKRTRVDLFDHGPRPILDPTFSQTGETLDEVG